MNAYIQTPQGDFDYVATDLLRGSSCEQCVLNKTHCCPYVEDGGDFELLCRQFDSDYVSFHLRPHYEIGGAS